MDNDYRQEILALVKSEFIGPCPEENPVENDEEVIEVDTPLNRYSMAILYPNEITIDEPGDEKDVDDEADGESAGDADIMIEGTASDEPEDDPINLANAYHQSAVSLTTKLSKTAKGIYVKVDFGMYHQTETEHNGKKLKRYPRTHESFETEIPFPDLPTRDKRQSSISVFSNGTAALSLHVANRETSDPKTNGMFTFSLVNESDSSKHKPECEQCFFQVEMTIGCTDPLQQLQESKRTHVEDNDYLNNQLLYRNVKSYGIGHGCAAVWDQYSEHVYEIKTGFIPTYEVRPVIPAAKGFSFDMLDMSKPQNRLDTVKSLNSLCDAYEYWIAGVRTKRSSLDKGYHKAADKNIENCETCLKRMRNGIAILKDNDTAFEAFCFANEAMLSQQLHYKLDLGKWVGGIDGCYEDLAPLPNLSDRESWPVNAGKWRTFQIAFMIMNLQSMVDRSNPERSIVDLIWFPTGGGKTEAYLGLSAFTLFIRRLMDQEDSGVTVLMRYTLRLLTTQQFERASSLICACEEIREKMPDKLGTERFSIGLWVGGSTSPNNQERAVIAYNKLLRKETRDNPFILLKCPSCGAQMGPTDSRLLKGYDTRRKPGGGRAREFHYECSNPKCHFSKEHGRDLPIYSIDEDVYAKRPSLVIGTVDKFAALPATPETRNLFGRGSNPVSPPDLIIQDELHLISGPLGSMVGFYETAIAEFCKRPDGSEAKIIGSTATISHAKEQCAALYGKDSSLVRQFPPSGIDADDSFFAVEEKDRSKPGRLYVGICSPGCSMAMSVINLYATLLMAPALAKGRISQKTLDGYWTNLGYFSSLRELGQAATWISGNILENLKAFQDRRWRKDPKFVGRNPNRINHRELTSRIPSGEIPASIKMLEVSLSSDPDSRMSPIDVCLSTNMISVGVDIQRLALMTVDGQPKTTSEYIQATSRVGRGRNPGIVFTIYSPTKARDKSHYEDFQRYHSKLYCNVEPTSITPFSAPLRDRAAKALLVSLVRQLCAIDDVYNPMKPTDADFERAKAIIMDRVDLVDPDEHASTESQIDDLIRQWKTLSPQVYTSKYTEQITPLIMRADSQINPAWQRDHVWEVPTSMRSVDAECVVKSINGEYQGGEDNA